MIVKEFFDLKVNDIFIDTTNGATGIVTLLNLENYKFSVLTLEGRTLIYDFTLVSHSLDFEISYMSIIKQKAKKIIQLELEF